MTTYYYRSNTGAAGHIEHDGKSMVAIQQAYNKIAEKLIADGWMKPDWQRRVRHEGKVKVGARKHHGLHQAGLLVVAGAMPPASWEMSW